MKKDLENLLLALSDDVKRFLSLSIDRRNFWYWNYYNEIENDIKNMEEKRKIYQQIYHLKRFGYINRKGFTLKGLTELAKVKHKRNKNKKWDGKWRVVIFDIPEKDKHLRNYFRSFLINLDFKKLQNSVWVAPYDDFEEIQDMIKSYSIAQYVVLMIVNKISNDLLFKKKFDL